MDATDKPASAPDAKVPAYSWYALSVLVLVYVLNFVDRQILSILANDIKADLGVDDAFLGFLYGTAFAIFYALFGIPLGKLADSWHRVRLMTIGLGLWSLMTAASGFAKNAAVLSGARVGVGIGEATASPSAYSLISDWFPARLRATALAIYSSGLYVGGGISLVIGALVVENWNAAYPNGGPLGLAGWQAAFIAVGLPGLLLAIWVFTLKEPVRGLIDGMPAEPVEKPFRGFFEELLQIIPPFTILGAARRSPTALAINLVGLVGFFTAAWLITLLAETGQGFIMGGMGFDLAISDQWFLLAVGYYAIFSWASALRSRDPQTFALTWGSPAFLCTILGYGTVAFISYATSYWGAPYGERVFEISKSELGLLLGAPAAVTGFLGVIIGGRVADWLFARVPAGRLYVVLFGLLAPQAKACPGVAFVGQLALAVECSVFTQIGQLRGDQFARQAQQHAVGRAPDAKARLHAALGVAARAQAAVRLVQLTQVTGNLTLEEFIGVAAGHTDQALVLEQTEACGEVAAVARLGKVAGKLGV